MFDDIVAGIVSSLLASIFWQLLIAFSPALIALALFLGTNPQITIIMLATGWVGSFVAFVVWFANHREHRRERMLAIARMEFTADNKTNSVQIESSNLLERPNIQPEIRYILRVMCDILAYRVGPLRKGATVLIPTHDQTFELFVSHRHDDNIVAHEIRTKLRFDNSLAGMAYVHDHFVELRDCRKPKQGIPWADSHNPPRFTGRAATPIRVVTGKGAQTVGVLCFDIKIAWTLTPEDRDLMQLFADKIASLWLERSSENTAKKATNSSHSV